MTSASMVLIPREDPLGKLIFVVVVLALGLVFFVALMTLLAAMMPGTVRRSRDALERTPVRAFLVGLAVSAIFGGAAGYLLSGSYVRYLLKTEWVMDRLVGGLAIIGVLVIVACFGAAGAVACVGERVARLAGRELSELKKPMWGAVTLVLAGWFPLAGWLVVTPITFMLSLGAALLGFLRRAPNRRQG